jgi:soluble lytic murein transglycosylase-like protein
MACQYEPQIRDAARRYGINEDVAVKQIMTESSCQNLGCNYAGACGVAQFKPATFAQYGSGTWSNVSDSLNAWGALMSHLLSTFGGDYRLALAGYHSGERDARAALNNCRGNPKTCAYVDKIMGNSANPSSPDSIGLPDVGSLFSNMSPTTMIVLGLGLIFLLRR